METCPHLEIWIPKPISWPLNYILTRLQFSHPWSKRSETEDRQHLCQLSVLNHLSQRDKFLWEVVPVHLIRNWEDNGNVWTVGHFPYSNLIFSSTSMHEPCGLRTYDKHKGRLVREYNMISILKEAVEETGW